MQIKVSVADGGAVVVDADVLILCALRAMREGGYGLMPGMRVIIEAKSGDGKTLLETVTVPEDDEPDDGAEDGAID